MRLLLVFFLLLTGTFNAQATALQKPVAATTVSKPKVIKKPLVLKIDSSKVELRAIDEQAVNNYSKQKEFIYDDVAPASMSMWDKFWRWFWRLISKLLNGDVSGGIIKYLLIALLVVGVVYAVIKIIGLDLKLLTKKSKGVEVPYEESLENIHEIDFDSQLEQAIENGNYRLAVRLLYLRTLKHLTDRNLIDWKLEKTNQAYVAELTNEKYKGEFTNLTNQFEYIWYGEFFIDKHTFEPINESFQSFNQSAK
ncbi:DUF4129 domain-containing protein [Pedobacter frigiditerrae]|uniref:DUF4129 domain-containing protein n=1 Tax=Pedobacter frigiditerrae TaxID=2530452 RepID=UPI00292FFA00|nr:DUF4129 domain-containing protein [Pedobacter frigiditerrae]